jgi:hypothetical protein
MKGSLKGKAALRGAASTALLIGILAGQALAAGTIKGKINAPAGYDLTTGAAIAVSEKLELYRVEIDADGNYVIADVAPGKYTISAIRAGLTVPDAVGVEVKDGATVEQNFTMVIPEPLSLWTRTSTPTLSPTRS